MIVCHCRSRSDREIREAVERGARTVEDVGRRCGAGSDCGACRPALEWLIVETIAHRRTLPMAASADRTPAGASPAIRAA